jgi:hypothetical protein
LFKLLLFTISQITNRELFRKIKATLSFQRVPWEKGIAKEHIGHKEAVVAEYSINDVDA